MYERNTVSGAQVDDLDVERMADFARARAPGLVATRGLEETWSRLGLVGLIGKSVTPTIAGLLLFGHHPHHLMPQWGVSAVQLDGTLLSDAVIERQDLEGSLEALLEGSLAFLEARAVALVDQVAPTQARFEHPPAATREALVNALVHRDLRLPARVALRLFSDRLEIWSPGAPLGVLPELAELALDGGVSMPRNPLLAAAARALGVGEQVGRGLPTIRRAVQEAGHDAVGLSADKVGVLVTIPSSLRAPETDPSRLS